MRKVCRAMRGAAVVLVALAVAGCGERDGGVSGGREPAPAPRRRDAGGTIVTRTPTSAWRRCQSSDPSFANKADGEAALDGARATGHRTRAGASSTAGRDLSRARLPRTARGVTVNGDR